jgi:hypothetical protein
MTVDGWREVVFKAMWDYWGGNRETLERLARALEESDRAKHMLRDAGVGCTGMGIVETVREAIDQLGASHGQHEG